MAGLTQKEQMMKALLLLDEAACCIDAALDRPGMLTRAFPLPETRQSVKELRRLRRELENNWDVVWRHQW